MDLGPILLSLKLASVTTLLLLLVGLPLAYFLHKMKSGLKPWLEALISLPIVLPPTVIGFYLLIVLSPGSGFGLWMQENLGIQLLFNFEGLVLGSMIYSLPFVTNPIQSGFESLPKSLEEAAKTLGKSNWQIFSKVLIPNIKPQLLTATVLGFAHTLGEFGLVLMIGGNVPGETRVASVALFELEESMHYREANAYALTLLGISFAILLLLFLSRRRRLLP
jgi:molybdate transport system permease protein